MIFLGKLLIIFGVLLILQNLGIIPKGVWEFFWPLVLILVGINLVWPGRWNHFWKDVNGKKIKIE